MNRPLTLIDQSLKTAAENLALDNALLAQVNSGQANSDILRFWESPEFAIVLGISGKVSEEVHWDECQAHNIPILRRASGGGTVLIGPGCLNYSLIFSFDNWPQYRDLTHSYSDILRKLSEALGSQCQMAGTSDLAQGQFKFSGNAQRRLPGAFIHHGTLLYDFDLAKVSQFLKEPPKQPAYRRKRRHSAFIQNLSLTRSILKERVSNCFDAELNWQGPLPEFQSLLEEKYQNPDWNLRR